ncbi:MAG: ABC transporter permease [Verrucomicrobia bacterium]|nr:ABC transporter permease [Verrucomicrobiota bacterium]
MALGAIAAHKLRSALTLLGIVIGVFSIIMVMTAMRVLQSTVENELSQLGAHTFAIQKFPAVIFGGPEDFEKYFRRQRILYAHGAAVKEQATLAQAVGLTSEFVNGREAISRYTKTNPDVDLDGDTPESYAAKNWVIGEGRGLSQTDLENARDVCVLGNTLAKKLFPRGSALDDTVKFGGVNYAVVGVLEAKNGMLGGNQDNFISIPLTTGLNRYGRDKRSLGILVQARDQASYADTIEQVRGILRKARKVPPGAEDDFEIVSNESLIGQFRSVTLAVRIGVAVVSSISLLTAGIGIMNIMLVSVTERTREIGIRRAIGAKKRNIMTQFIMEAIALCEVGGVLGVLLGIVGGNVAAYFMKVTPVIPLDWALIGLVICSIVGIVFGTYPAYKAANLDPIESLRYE